MAQEDSEERRSDDRDRTSVDLSTSHGGASHPGGRRNPEPSIDAPPKHNAADAEADPGADAAPAEAGEVIVDLPAGGGISVAVLLALLSAAVVLFLVVLFACAHAWTAGGGEAAELAADLAPSPADDVRPLPSPELLSGLSFSELTETAQHCMTAADYTWAAVLYAAASEREEEGLPRTLLARHKLAGALALAGRYGEATHVVESLRAISRPGDELWKNSGIAAIGIEQAQGRWADFRRSVHLLRANSHRYGDEQSLNRWLAYVEAMAAVEDVMARSEGSRVVYGVQPPPFGRAPYKGRPMAAEDIVPVSGKYGDGTLQAGCRLGEMRLRAEGAPLSEVLAAIASAAGITVECDAPQHYVVVADIDGVPPQQCLETVLGSVGLALATEGERLIARPAQPRAASVRRALDTALWGLQEFLILCPDSPELPEAYYALSHLYMSQGQRQMALDQLGVLAREFPRSPWTVYAHYVQGRASCEQGDWSRGEQELLAVADDCTDAALTRSAFLYAARCQRELGEYVRAVSCFRRALAGDVGDPLSPNILYNIAFCLEKSGASPLEVEERYMELRTRFPASEYAREADYRLARMVLDAGDYWKAASRYEVYLENWSADDERGRRACSDLLLCYVRSRDYVRAVLLGEVMRHSFGAEPTYADVLPLIVEAYEEGKMMQLGLEAIDSSLTATKDAAARCFLMAEKARFQVALNMCKEARDTLNGLEDQAQTATEKARVLLARAALLMAEAEPDRGCMLCREVATRCTDEALRERALRMLGAYYQASREFDKAVLAYSGSCPQASEGGVP